MKKIISILFAIVFATSLCISLCGCSPEYSSEKISFVYDKDTGGYRARWYFGKAQYVEIPDSYDDGTHGTLPVNAIGDIFISEEGGGGLHATFWTDKVLKIKIPASVKYINELAFRSSSLEEIIFMRGSQLEEFYGLDNCENFKGFTVKSRAKHIELKDGILFNKTTSTLMVYPASLQKQTYKVPAGTKKIGYDAFRGCTEIENIIMPQGLTHIAYSAFDEAPKSVVLPSSLVEINGLCSSISEGTTKLYYEGSKEQWLQIASFDGRLSYDESDVVYNYSYPD